MLLNAAGDTMDWRTYGRDYAETRFSPLEQINPRTIEDLGLEWMFLAGVAGAVEGTPIVIEGTMYVSLPWGVVVALDGRSGARLWQWDAGIDRRYAGRGCCGAVNRGVAVFEDKLYVGVFDGRLVALDRHEGRPVWEALTVDPALPYTITGAPRVLKGKVVIGNGGADLGVRGYVSAYDAENGALVWRSYTVPGNPSEPFENEWLRGAAETWSGEWWKYGGGGTAWDSFSYDPELDLLYVGTGNGSPLNQPIRSPEGGDNLYLASILALRPDDGKLIWYYQTTPGETWNYTATQHMILADIEWSGTVRRVLLQAPKNGFFYVIDRGTGELLGARAFVPTTWATEIDINTGRPIEQPGMRYLSGATIVAPGPLGAHNWQPMSYSPTAGLVYIPAQEVSSVYTPVPSFVFRPGMLNLGVSFSSPGSTVPEAKGYLLAWDPSKNEERWRVDYGQVIGSGGTLSTAGGVVFQGTSDGWFRSFHAATGEVLWEVFVGASIIAPPVTYAVDGVQYVTVMAGGEAGGGWGARGGGGYSARVLTFALQAGGPATVSGGEVDAREQRVGTSSGTPFGRVLYQQWCSNCHWDAATAASRSLRDLRIGPEVTLDRFVSLVLGDRLIDKGMPSFARWLGAAEVEAIEAYLRGDVPSR